MNKGLSLLSTIGLGAGLMYVLDPDRGHRRRGLIRDKVTRALHKTGDALDTTSRDLTNRARGWAAETRSLFGKEEIDNDVLVERVRAKIGRVVSHPHSISVTADQGRVTLSGPILEDEVNDLLDCVWRVRGATGVEDRLEVHKQAGDVPGLQGGVKRPGMRSEFMQENWSPAARTGAALAGGALLLLGTKRMGLLGTALGVAGLTLAARGVTNKEVKRLIGTGGGRRAVDIEKTINIAAPVEQVFDFWRNFENFPRFMTNVREVRDLGGGRSHWTVAGPAGVPVEWDAEVTREEPNQVLAWKSLPGSAIANAGIVEFQPGEAGGTRVHIRFSYNPPGGAVGHAAATLFGADPKAEMDADLLRMKTMIETGTPPHDAAQSQSQRAR